MQLVLAVAIALLIVAVVAWPLLMRRRNAPTPPVTVGGNPRNDNSAALNAVYDAIRTLQTEHGLGRVNDDDYQEQLGRIPAAGRAHPAGRWTGRVVRGRMVEPIPPSTLTA